MKKVLKVIVANIIINIIFVSLSIVISHFYPGWFIGEGAIFISWLWAGTITITTITLIVKK